ncbi:MAG: hypothetical protein K2X27_09640 [Candidatus Obscuribacterales bacterium]|nr:hypothetical protein [Candidatus Obscuribacterales bacterium]
MKISKQLILLLGLPIGCQMLSVGMLIYSYSKVDELVNKELKAKRVISAGIHIRALLQKSICVMSNKGIAGIADIQSEVPRQSIQNDFALIRKLSSSEAEAAKRLDLWQKDVEIFLDSFDKLLAQINESDKEGDAPLVALQTKAAQDQMLNDFKRVNNDTNKMLAIYTPIAAEFHPKAMKARANLRGAVILGVAANVILVACFAVLLNRNIMLRLLLLLNNIKAFSVPGQKISRLNGNDELAEIDQVFQEMSNELEKLESFKQSMRAMVSHDLRSPLTSMGLRVELILEDIEDVYPQLTGNLKTLNSEIQRLRRLANTLLDIEKMEDGSIEVQAKENSCADLITVSIEAVLAQSKRKEITIKQSLVQCASMYCDRDRSIQVLVNFLSNAVKFAPRKSEIEIKVCENNEDSWSIEILDQGPGVAEDAQNKLFAKFVQLEQSADLKKQGSGLGLYICKMLIEAQNGRVGYKKRAEGGSCFWFELPKAALKALLLFTVLLSQSVEAADSSGRSSWRTYVRSARLDIDKSTDLTRALSVYSKALIMIEQDDPDCEAKYDIYLNIAEVYRRLKNFRKAEETLEKVRPFIESGKLKDRIMEARYWRRWAGVYLEEDKIDKSLNAYSRAIETLEKYLPFKSNARDLLLLAQGYLNRGKLQAALTVAAGIKKNALGQHDLSIIDKGLEELSNSICAQVHLLLSQGNDEEAENLLAGLNKLPLENRKSVLDAWTEHLYSSNTVSTKAASCLEEYLSAISTKTASDAAQIEMLRAELFERNAEKLKALNSFQKALDYSLATRNKALSMEILERFRKFLIDDIRNENLDISLLEKEVQMSSSNKMPPWASLNPAFFNKIHARKRLMLALAYARLNKIEAAQEQILSISKNCIKDLPFYNYRLLITELEILRACQRSKKAAPVQKDFPVLESRAEELLSHKAALEVEKELFSSLSNVLHKARLECRGSSKQDPAICK